MLRLRIEMKGYRNFIEDYTIWCVISRVSGIYTQQKWLLIVTVNRTRRNPEILCDTFTCL